jgi:Sperm-tail PG-rich repeat
MVEKYSLRQVGREVTGKLYKGPIVDAYNRLTQPSIPTRIEQILMTPSIKEGFNSSADRFSSYIAKAPGPGDYDYKLSKNPSISQKSYLISQSSRFKNSQYRTSVPGPGSYDNRKIKTSSITISGRPKSFQQDNFPPPGHYDPSTPNSTKEVTSMFKSNTKRMKSAPNADMPAPWQYNIAKPKIPPKTTSSFVIPSNRKREQINLYDPHAKPASLTTPGPGEYNETKNISNKPSSMFSSNSLDRFGIPLRRRKREIIPGPADYSLDKENTKNFVTGAVFMSESKRTLMKIRGKPPGPAFYSPMPVPKKKSFHYKATKIWI